ncbi:MAG TPA: hypothetical protein PLL81_04935 [Bacillota bacterium]|nr:hypothetical protein [Bacillota bacterium]HQE01521.1 hypothetical protein [Bacillota bacterium]
MTLILLSAGILLLLGGPVCAHRPVFPQAREPYDIPDPAISLAIYRELGAGQVDYFRFSVPRQGMEFACQLMVPARSRSKDFRPVLVLIGPGLPDPGPEIPVAVPPGLGAEAEEWWDGGKFFEPFTQTSYRMGPKVRRHLPAGEWQLAVYHPPGTGGKYTLAVGERESWGWRDLLRFPGLWLRIRWWYNPGQTVAAILAGLALAAFSARRLAKFLGGRG